MAHLLSHEPKKLLSNMASPVFTEGVAAHVIHSYQLSRHGIGPGFEEMPPQVIL